MIDWRGQVALVTGGASGIGLALAEALAARGAQPIIADIDSTGAHATAERVGGSALTVDLSDPGAAAALIERAYALAGRVDFIASNAGMGGGPGARRLLKVEIDAPRVARMFEVNMFAFVRLAQAWVPRLEAAGTRGRLMITGSENSLSVPEAVRTFGLGLYGASKHGALVLAEWLRGECVGGNKPLDVSILLPGGVYTGMTADGLGPDPEKWPAAMGIIRPEVAAAIALHGLDEGLFYIPTHRHLGDDIEPRYEGIKDSIRRLGL